MAIGTTKVIASALITGTVGGGITAGAYFLSNNTTVKDRLTKEGFKLAEEGDWTKILEEHNKGDSSNAFRHESPENKNEEWLKDKCEKALNSNDETNYKSARQWCTKTEEISVIFNTGKLRVLNSEESKDDDKVIWLTKLTQLSKDDVANKEMVISKSEENEKIKEIKTKCREIFAITNTNKEFDKKYELAKEWCSL